MKKMTKNLVWLMALVVLALNLTSCSGRDKADLLACAPAEAEVVLLLDAQEVWDQLEIKKKGDSFNYCTELDKILNLIGAKRSEVNQVLECLDETQKSMLAFTYKEQVWITFFIRDTDEFVDVIEDIAEENGQKISFSGYNDFLCWERMAIRDNQVWAQIPMHGSQDQIDVRALEDLYQLKGENRFVKEYDDIASEMLASDGLVSLYVNINGVMSLGDISPDQRAMLNMALGTVYDDARSVLITSRLNNDGLSAETRVLNSKQKNAKYLLPTATIKEGELSKVNCNAPLVGAIAIPNELMKKVTALIAQMQGGSINASEQPIVDLLNSLGGTIALSMESQMDYTVSIGFIDANAASTAGNIIASLMGQGNPVSVSAAGNYLIIRSNDKQVSGGTMPKGFAGQYSAVWIDPSKVSDKLVKGYNFSKFGTLLTTAGPEGDGMVTRSEWKLKSPMRTLLIEAMNITNAVVAGQIQPGTAFEQMYAPVQETYTFEDDVYAESAVAASYEEDIYNY